MDVPDAPEPEAPATSATNATEPPPSHRVPIRDASSAEQCLCQGPRASVVLQVDAIDEEMLKQVEQMDKLINAAASSQLDQLHPGNRRVLPISGAVTRRKSTIGITTPRTSSQTQFETMASVSGGINDNFELPGGTISLLDGSRAELHRGKSGSINMGRSRKVFPRQNVIVDGTNGARSRRPSERRQPSESEATSWHNRRSSQDNRRSSLASIKDDVVKIAQNVSRIFEKSAPADSVDERRQAKVAELVNREVMVLNASQLAQMQQKNAHPFTISLHSTFRHWWDFVVTVSIAYVMVTTPLKVSFAVKTSGISYVIDVIVDLIYLVEMVINFFTSYEDDTTGEEIKDLVKVRRNYIKTWFLMDAVSSFPSSLVGKTNDLLTLTKILKVARVAKISESGLIRTITGRIDRTMNPSLMRILTLTSVFFVTQHFIACGYYYIGLNYSMDTDWGPSTELRASSLTQQYIDALYFAIMVTTANDVNPTTGTEKVFVSVMLFLGIVINASIIGSAANLLSNLDKEAIARKNQMDSINDYLRFKKVSLPLQNKIRRYYEYALNSRMQDPMDNLFADLPDRLKLLLRLNLHSDFIRKVPLFKVCSHAGVIAIVQCLIHVVAMPGEIVVAQGEVGNEFYFIKSGQVSLCVRAMAELIPMGNLGEGSFFGETSLLSGEPATSEVKAERVCELAYLTRENFAAIIDKFPTFYLAVKRISESRLQTAQNVQKMSKFKRRPTQNFGPKKLSFGSMAMIAIKKSNHGRRLSALGKHLSDSRSRRGNNGRRPMSMRFSTSRRMTLPAFDAQFVDKLSLAQARHLTNIKSIGDVQVAPEEELPYD